ncbi:MAG: glycoside hydrolase N-terminal domain-containing protein [Roseburia sp.]|nr:glycoside hydrolase N-terminal domain-containing protein [Roseburia sp.]
MRSKKLLASILAAAMVVTSIQFPSVQVKAEENRNALTLWYDEPASQGQNILSAGAGYSDADGSNTWQQQTLPIGNGDMGANVYGEIVSEHLTFNEKTLWTGGPSESRPNYMGGNNAEKGQNGTKIKEIQAAFLAGNISQGEAWCGSYLVGDSAGYGAYQPWGDIYFDYKGLTDGDALVANDVENYERNLDLTTAISNVSFTKDGTDYTREFFISHDDNVLVGRLEAEGTAKLNFDVRFTSKQSGTTVAVSDNTLALCGAVPDNQLKYASYIIVVPEGENSTVTGSGDKLTVADATAVTVYVSAATDYKNVFYNPADVADTYYYRTGESDEALAARVKADVDSAVTKGYAAIKADHISDYKELFDRVTLNLGQTVSDKTTDQLLAAYKNGTATEPEKRQLEVMLFQYGRYLTIASSREDSQLPANLQGVWNYLNSPPWASDYHMNVNLQMNYWPTYSTNLAECAIPLIDYIDSLREPGRVTAEVYFGVESAPGEANGFNAHTQCTPFGWTCPGWSFDWGWSPAAVPWILQNCWEYYEFTGDVEFMRTNIYPMLKEEALFYDATLIRDNEGKLVSAPSYSPETGPRTAGNTYEQSLTWQLYEDAITAATILGVDADLVEKWTKNQADLKGPIEIGDDGQIKEWYNETSFNKDENGNNMGEGFSHRHISHMLGLFPGDLIAQNEEWLEAARVSMNLRTDSSTGWGMGQRINTWARLGDGNRAHKLIGDLFKGGIYPNLCDSHSPFQIDGNFGMTSGVSEMLVQSNMGFIDLLPALPDAWATGSVDGLVARGNFEIDMTWENGSLTGATILSKNGGECIVDYYTINDATIVDENGTPVAVTDVQNGRISFATEAGKTYTVKEIPEKPANAPTNGKAVCGGTEAIVSFDTVLNATEYKIYASTDSKNYEVIATATTNEYKDTNYTAGKTYKVSSVVSGKESIISNMISPTVIEFVAKIDDQDGRIVYNDGFANYNSDQANYNGTEKYSTKDGATAEFYFYGNKVDVIGMKNTDCHTFDLYVDGALVKENVDTNATSCQRQQVLATVDNLTNGLHKVKLVVKQKKVSLDAFAFNTIATGMAQILGKDTLNLKETATLQLTAEYIPAGASGAGVNWSVDNTNIATIDENGLLTALDVGTVVVTATDKENAAFTTTKTITIESKALLKEIDSAILAENAMANSEQWPAAYDNDGKAAWAFDNEDHWWHTRYQGNKADHEVSSGIASETNPIWIQTGFDKKLYVEKIEYTGRTTRLWINDYKISVANLEDPTATPKDTDFTVVKEGHLEPTGAKQTITLDKAVAATHVRITVTSTHRGDGDGNLAAKKISIFAYDENPYATKATMKEYSPAILAKNAKTNSEMNPASGNDGLAAWAFDDEEHMWHSRYSGTPLEGEVSNGVPSETNPIWIQTGFDKEWYVSAIEYTGRDEGNNLIGKYEISVANLANPKATPQDSDFKKVAEGTNTSKTMRIELEEAVAATHVRITAYSKSGGGSGEVVAKNISIFGYDAIADVAGYTLTLEGNVGVNFHTELIPDVLADENAYMNFKLGGKDYMQVPVADATEKEVDGTTYYVFKCTVPVKDMETEITGQIILSDGRTSSEFKYTVKDYADKITSGAVSSPEETVALVEAMSNFGDFATSYFAEGTLEETEEMKAVTAETLDEFKAEGPENSIYYGSSLLLKSNTILRHYFKEEVEGATPKGNLYYVETEGIPAHKLGDELVMTVDGMTITYNPLSYAYIALSRDDVDENLKSVMRAMYLYYEAAQDYLEANN